MTTELTPHDQDAMDRFAAGLQALKEGKPICFQCGAPATCIGKSDGETVDSYACDECCGHGNEDGRCTMLDPNHVNTNSDFA